MKRVTWAAIAGIAVAVVAAGAILWGSAAGAPPPVTNFPPWYAAENAGGDPAVADFEAHVPCAIDPVPEPACQRVKLGLVLYRDAATGEPSTYVMSIVRVGVSDEREVRQGEWHIETGMALDAEATVFRLGGAPEHLRAYWAVGDDLLLLLDGNRMPRVGDAAYGYTLNRVALRRG